MNSVRSNTSRGTSASQFMMEYLTIGTQVADVKIAQIAFRREAAVVELSSLTPGHTDERKIIESSDKKLELFILELFFPHLFVSYHQNTMSIHGIIMKTYVSYLSMAWSKVISVWLSQTFHVRSSNGVVRYYVEHCTWKQRIEKN